jgi:uncharacterized protein with LGFP repeats
MSAIDDKWFQIQWIGPPKDEGAGSAEMSLPDGRGRVRDYQNGSIYWTRETGAHEVHGDIRVKWARMRWLGYPLTDETGTPDGVGRYNHFEHGSVYWTPQTGAWEVHGAIRDLWASMGWETGAARYPTSDERDDPSTGGRFSRFQGGVIRWTAAHGAAFQKASSFDD